MDEINMNAKTAKHIKSTHEVLIDPYGKTYFHYQIEDLCEDQIDECCEVVSIGTFKYNPGRVLREVDPIAFNEEVNNFIDDLLSEQGWTEGTFTYDELTAHQELVKAGNWINPEDAA